MKNAIQLKIVGVVRPAEDANNASIGSAVGYTKALTDYIIGHTDESAVVKAQRENKTVNVLNGLSFAPEDDAAKIADARTYIASLGITDKATMYKTMMQSMGSSNPQMMGQMGVMDESQMAAALDAYLETAEDDVLLSIYDIYISSGTYDENMESFGVISLDAPASISIYANSFEAKDAISTCIDDYNKTVSEENQCLLSQRLSM